MVVGCTGGIGAGKSSVASLLAVRGATVLDADAEARQALAPGTPGHAAAAAAFPGCLRPDGELDRSLLARLVFADAGARAALEAIVHPLVQAALAERLERLRPAGGVAVLELPLLVETGGRHRYRLDGVLVVDAPEELALERLVAQRGMPPEAARARIAAQAPREERLRAADYLILNTGSFEELRLMVALAWGWIRGL